MCFSNFRHLSAGVEGAGPHAWSWKYTVSDGRESGCMGLLQKGYLSISFKQHNKHIIMTPTTPPAQFIEGTGSHS